MRLGLSILLHAGRSAERAGRNKIAKEDIKSAFESERTTEILKSVGEMQKRLKKRKQGKGLF